MWAGNDEGCIECGKEIMKEVTNVDRK